MFIGNQKFSIYQERIPGVILGILALLMVVSTQSRLAPPVIPKSVYIAPPPMFEHFTFGFNEVMADSLWIRLLQDLDYCEQSIAENTCKNDSWLYHMVDTVTNLSPDFRIAYAVGGLALTVLITDIDGATKIFDKSVKAFPKDWPILYRAAYHYLYEVKDNKRAAELLLMAADNGAPPWTRTLAGRLYTDSGNVDLAEKLLQDMKSSNQDPHLIKRLEQKIESMKARYK
ncbi:tetratricopeptide repeat protein [Bdellovibrio sp. SKB1291214]|uniref:tetratricopeptide repeat protein n=1 Tax=Bdellovibrio sp. SKB1291214 TaxID=1732569 RepID=UPI0020CE753B|nr:tetratricopeptide repeat protein [Bdellovibrio sp. SKB1291214]UYL09537.1 tetratricopeptide repeat protein [Bdellovibrio sp. SKB1291214]